MRTKNSAVLRLPQKASASPYCLPRVRGPGAPGKRCGALFSAEGGRKPWTVAAKPPDEVLFKLHTAYEMEEERLFDRG